MIAAPAGIATSGMLTTNFTKPNHPAHQCAGITNKGTMKTIIEDYNTALERNSIKFDSIVDQYLTDVETTTTREVSCGRCSGQRVFQHYKHRSGGICFRCQGTGTETITETHTEKHIDFERMVSDHPGIELPWWADLYASNRF